MRRIIQTTLYAALVLAGCYESNSSRSDVTGDPAPDTHGEMDIVADPDLPGEPDGPPGHCPERVLPASCPVRPPDCPEGYFPAVANECFTGSCLHCIDGCQSDADCVPVQVCGCGYHEGCGWTETTYRLALETDACIQPTGSPCPGSCIDGPSCPPVCERAPDARCCGWCDPPDGAQCQSGSCVEILTHPCE